MDSLKGPAFGLLDPLVAIRPMQLPPAVTGSVLINVHGHGDRFPSAGRQIPLRMPTLRSNRHQ